MVKTSIESSGAGSTSRRPAAVRGAAQAGAALLTGAAGALAAALLAGAAALALGSCSSRVDTAIRPDGGARASVRAEMPAPLAARLRKLGQLPPDAPLFDIPAVRKSLAARPGLSILELSAPAQDSISADIAVRSLEELAAAPDLAGSGLIALTRASGWTELRVKIERGDARALAALFPGLDPYLLESLSPPALEEEPVTAAEYRTMLASVLGAKAMPAMEMAGVVVTLQAPGPVLASGGGSLSGASLSLRLGAIELLTLERPIEFWLRWQSP